MPHLPFGQPLIIETCPFSNILEDTMIAAKNIYPNLDCPAGHAYYMMAFKIEMFTPIFVMTHLSGWAAHIMEQFEDNRLVRPLPAPRRKLFFLWQNIEN